jgi:hypothetical protein
LFEHLVGRHAQLLLHVQCAGRKEQVDARRGTTLQRLGGTRDVAVVGASQRAHGAVLDRVGDRLHAFEVAVRRGGKTGLDHVHLQSLELAGDPQLLVLGHRGAGRLLAVTQGGVENDQLVGHGLAPDERGES